MKILNSLVLLLGSTFALSVFAAQSGTRAASSGTVVALTHEALGGIWVLDRNRGSLPGAESSTDDGGDRRRSGGGGGYGGRRGGGGGFGGGFGGGQRGGGGRQMVDPERMRAIGEFIRSATAASTRLTIVVHESSVAITDADGATVTVPTDDKKVEERAENGLVRLTRKSRWEGPTLVSEIEIEQGPKIERRYELSPAGTELDIKTKISGGFGGRGAGSDGTITKIYERPLEEQ